MIQLVIQVVIQCVLVEARKEGRERWVYNIPKLKYFVKT